MRISGVTGRPAELLEERLNSAYREVIAELEQRFPNPEAIVKEKDNKEFVKLFGEYLQIENFLQNFDEFASLKALQGLDNDNQDQVDAFKAEHHLSDDDLATLQSINLPSDRKIQDYRSTYNDIRDWLRREKTGNEKEQSTVDWADVVFEVDLLKSQEINLDYILELIFEHNKNDTELNAVLPKMSPLNPQYLTKKQSVFQKIAAFVEKFKGVGGEV